MRIESSLRPCRVAFLLVTTKPYDIATAVSQKRISMFQSRGCGQQSEKHAPSTHLLCFLSKDTVRVIQLCPQTRWPTPKPFSCFSQGVFSKWAGPSLCVKPQPASLKQTKTISPRGRLVVLLRNKPLLPPYLQKWSFPLGPLPPLPSHTLGVE